MKSVRRVSSLPNSCSCSSCLYRTESDRPSLSRIVSQGSKIDKLYYGKYIPLRERKLLEKLIRTRAVYDDIRDQLVSSSSSSLIDLAKTKKLKGKEMHNNEKKDPKIAELVGLVDKGVILTPDSSECCSCCSCSSKIKLSDETNKPFKHKHHRVPNREKRSMTSKSSVISRQRVDDEMKNEHNVHFKTKEIKSDPCTCTFKIGKIIKRHSKAVLKKFTPERPQPLIETHREAFEEHRKEEVGGKLRKSYQQNRSSVEEGARKSIRKIKKSPTKVKENVKLGIKKSTESIKKSYKKLVETAHGQQVNIPVTENVAQGDTKGANFKIKKDSVTQFRDKLRKKHELDDWACVETCDEQTCKPEKCLKEVMKKMAQRKSRTTKQDGTHSYEKRKKSKKTNLSKTEINKAVQLDVGKDVQLQDKKKKMKTKETLTKKDDKAPEKSQETQPKSKLELKIQPSANIKMTEKATTAKTGTAPESISDKKKMSEKASPARNDVIPVTITDKKKTSEKATPAGDITGQVPTVSKKKMVEKASVAQEDTTAVPITDKKKTSQKTTAAGDATAIVPAIDKKKISEKVTPARDSSIPAPIIDKTKISEKKILPRDVTTTVPTISKKDTSEKPTPARGSTIPAPITDKPKISEKKIPTQDVTTTVPTTGKTKTSGKASVSDKKKIVEKAIPEPDRSVEPSVPTTNKKKSKAVITSNEPNKPSRNKVVENQVNQKSNPQIHKQIQSKQTHSNIGTQSGHLLKRCFCTLKLKKRNAIKGSKFDFTNSESNSKNNMKQRVDAPNNCDRQICKLGECNPEECQNKIKMRIRKNSDLLSKGDAKNEKNISKMNISLQGIQSKFFGKSGDENLDRLSNAQERNSQRQVVRISSTFSFSVEFSKHLSEPQFQQQVEAYKKQRIAQKRQSVKDKTTNKKKIKTQHKNSQISNQSSKSTRTSIKYGIKRCFCTLKINKKGTKLKSIEHAKATLTPKNLNKIKHEQPSNLKSISTTANIKTSITKKKLLPYECEPGVCVPGECDPYKCHEIIKERDRKRLKHHSVKSNTENKETKSSLTVTPRYVVPLRTKKVQSVYATKKLVQANDNVKRSVSVPKQVKDLPNEHKQAVRVGSSFSFDIEFYKENQKPDIKAQALKQTYSVSHKPKLSVERKPLRNSETQDVAKSKNKITAQDAPKKKSISIGPTLKKCFCTLQFHKNPDVKQQKPINAEQHKSIPTKDFSTNSNIVQHKQRKHNIEPNECEPNTCVPGQCDPYRCLEIIKNRKNTSYENTGVSTKHNLKSVHSSTENNIINKSKRIATTPYKKDERELQKISEHTIKDSSIESKTSQKFKDIRRSQVKVGSDFSFGIEFYKDNSMHKSFVKRPHEKARILSQAASQSVTRNKKNEGVQILKSKNKNSGVATIMKRCFCTLALQKQNGQVKKSLPVLEKSLKDYTVNRVAVESINVSKTITSTLRKTINTQNTHTEEEIEEICISELSSSSKTTDCLIIPPLTIPQNDTSNLNPFFNQSFYSMNFNVSAKHIKEKHFYKQTVEPYSCDNAVICDKNDVEKSRYKFSSSMSNTKANEYMKQNCKFKNEHENEKLKKTFQYQTKKQKYLDKIDSKVHFAYDRNNKKSTCNLKEKYSNSVSVFHQKCQLIKSNAKFRSPSVDGDIESEKNVDKDNIQSNNRSYSNHDRLEESPSFLKRCFSVLKSLTAKSISSIKTDKGSVTQLTPTLDSRSNRFESFKLKRIENQPYDSNQFRNKSVVKLSYLPRTVPQYNVASTKRSYVDNNKLVTSKTQKGFCVEVLSNNNKTVSKFNTANITKNYGNIPSIEANKRTSSFGIWMQKCFCTLALHKQSIYRNHRDDSRRTNKYSDSFDSGNGPLGGRKARKLEPYECEPNVCIPGQCDPYECDKRIRRRNRKESGVGTNAVGESSQSTLTSMPKFGKNIKIQSMPKSSKVKRLGEAPRYSTISHAKHGDSESRKAVRIGSKFSFDIEFYKDKGNINSIKFTKLPKEVHRRVKNRERASVTTRSSSSRKVQDSRDARHADTQSGSDQDIKSTMTNAPFLKRCFCTLKLHQNTEKTSSFDAATQDALPESPDVITAERGTKTKKVTYTPVYHLEPYECEPGVCVPGQCNPYECDKRIQLRRKMHSVSSNTQRNTRSSVSMQHKPNKYRARRSQVHSKYPKRHKQSHVNQILKTVSERIPNRQAIRIGSNFSFNIEFYKDVPQEQNIVRERRVTQDETQSDMKVRKLPVGVQGINFRHRQSQMSGPRIKSRDSGVSPILKRCFCTLKLHKMGKQQTHQAVQKLQSPITLRSSYAETKKEKICPEQCSYNTGTATIGKNIYNLEPYECEPGVCTPGYCDPYECDLRIRRRQMKTMCTETDCPRLRETGSLAAKSYTSKSMKTNDVRQRNAQLSAMRDRPMKYKPSKVIKEDNNSNRQSVRIGSTFSFNIEFFKENDALNSGRTERISNEETSFSVPKPKRTRNRSSTSSTRKSRSQFSERKCSLRCQKIQAETAQTQSRGSGMPPLLKRCFCTLALHKKNIETSRAEHTQINESPEIAPQIMYSRSTGTKNKYFPQDLKPYECEPGTCEPGQCNPYECEKRIQARNAKYSETGTHTKPSQYFSTSSMTRDASSRKCKNVQCKGKERTYATSSPRRKHPRPRPSTDTAREHIVPNVVNTNRQVVKIGSSFKFDVEFFKDKPSAETESRPRPQVQDRSLERSYKSGECNTKCQGVKNTNTQPNRMSSGESQADGVKTENKGSYVENVLKRCFCTMALHKNDNIRNASSNQQKSPFGGKQYQVYYQFKSSNTKGAQKLDVASKDCPCTKKGKSDKTGHTVATNTSKKYFKAKQEAKNNPLEPKSMDSTDLKQNNMETILPYKPRKFNKKTSKILKINNKSENIGPGNKLEVPGGKIRRKITKTKTKVKKLDKNNNLGPATRSGDVGQLTGTFDSKLFHGKIAVNPVTKLALENDIAKGSDCSQCAKKPLASILKYSKSLGRGMNKKKENKKSSNSLKTDQLIQNQSGGAKPIISRAVLKLYTHNVSSESHTNIVDDDEERRKEKVATNKMVKFSIDPAKKKKTKQKNAAGKLRKKDKSKSAECDSQCNIGATSSRSDPKSKSNKKKTKKSKKSDKTNEADETTKAGETNKAAEISKTGGDAPAGLATKTGDGSKVKAQSKDGKSPKDLKKTKGANSKSINICDCGHFRDDMICTCFSSNCECAKAIKLEKKREKEMKIKRKKLQKKIKRHRQELKQKEKDLKKKREQLEIRRKKYKREDAARQKHRRNSEKYLDKRIRKLKDTSDILLAADSLMDIAKLGFSVVGDVGRSTCRAISDPCYTYDSVKRTLKHPTRIFSILKNAILNSGAIATLKRVFRRFLAMEVVKSGTDRLNDYGVTSYIMGMAENDPVKRLKRKGGKKKPQPRRDKDFQCNLYMNSLRKKPYLSVYYTCPWFYPHFMALLNAVRQLTDLLLFLLAVVVWSPCILCTELCRAMLCCFVCTG